MKVCPKCGKEHELNGRFCSKSCANSRTWSDEDKKKKSDSVKKFIKENGPNIKKGIKMPPQTKEHTAAISAGVKAYYDKRGRQTIEQKRAKNVSGVQAYRARKYSATPDDVDRKLIRKIYECCPVGYEVDHIVAIANGGHHHQKNLQYLPTHINRKKNKYDNYDSSQVIRWQDIIKE